jgi:type I restriction enzyme S subunit
MAGSRNRLPLSDLCEAIIDCEHKTAPTQPWGIPSIRTTNIKNGRLDIENANRVSEETYKKWTARLEPQPGDLILAREAPVGEVGIVPLGQRVCLGQRTVLIRTNQQKLLSRYLLYLLLTPEMRHEMVSRAEGSTVPHLNMSDIRNLEIPHLPTLPEQKAIAHILGTLDDKIELNQQMNRNLEAIASAIFKSWFVDFDPVRARVEGREPAEMDAATAALFPDSFEDSLQVTIPKGWKVAQLNEITKSVRGISYKSADLQESKVALVTLKSIARGGGYQEEGLKPYTGGFKPEQEVKPGEIVVAHTDLTQSAEVLGKAARVRSHHNFSKLVASLDLAILRPIQQSISSEFLYGLLSQPNFQEHAYGYANGTTVLHLSAKALPEYRFIMPSPNLVEVFTKVARPLYQTSDMNEEQCRTLATIRDTLLPKLMSGETRVKEAEKIVEAVT